MTEVRQTASPDTLQMLAALQEAVRKCLERKQRLEQYAVMWKDGKPQRLILNPSQVNDLAIDRKLVEFGDE